MKWSLDWNSRGGRAGEMSPVPSAYQLGISDKNMKQLITFTLLFMARLDGSQPSGENTSRPNIILLMGDDHGWEEVGYYGHPYLKTPFLDEMAASGLRLDKFYAQPVCSPTRGNVLTGRHPNRYGTFTPGRSL